MSEAGYKPAWCKPGEMCFSCPLPECRCCIMPTKDESRLKVAGNQIPVKRLEKSKRASDWLNHSLAKG